MIKISNHFVSRVIFFLLLIEAAILVASAYLGAAIRFLDGSFLLSSKLDYFFLSATSFAMVMVFSMSVLGMYQHDFREGFRNTLLRLMPALILGLGILTLIFYMLPDLYFGRGILGIVIIIATCGILMTRTIFLKSSDAKILESRIIFLGGGLLAKECSELASNSAEYNRYEIIGFVPIADEELCVPLTAVLPGYESLISLVKKYKASEIVVSVVDRRSGTFPIKELLDCKLGGINVTDAAAFFEREACQIRVDSLQPSWLVFGGGFDQGFLRIFVKRTFDICASIMIFLFSLPIMLIAGLCIFIENGGPVFYHQERVGKNGKSFTVIKFRSMQIDAESGGIPQWASINDSRVTKVGKIIRKLRIDELPQILNVLKGEMSLVGPRPERPYFVNRLCEEVPFYKARHSVKPGITGLAQVRYQYGASIEDAIQKLQYDLYYVKNNSLFLDMIILIDTLQVVLFGKGSR